MVTTFQNELRVFAAMKSIATYAPARPVVVADGIVSICGWCPNARARTIELTKQGHRVSHGMCPTCKSACEAQMLEGR